MWIIQDMDTSLPAAPVQGEGMSPPAPTVAVMNRSWPALVVAARAGWWIHARRAVVLDTETTGLDGQVCELAALDAATGTVLFDSLIRPDCPVEDDAAAVHGISAARLHNAPTWSQVWPMLTWALQGRLLAAYNAPFDQAAIVRTCHAAGIDPGPIGDDRSWRCIMRARAQAERRPWRRLEGGHRALADTHAARTVLLDLATARPTAPSLIEPARQPPANAAAPR